MQNEFNTGYQYNRCISRGICSINPATASLQEVIIGYLKIAAFYGLKLQEFNVNDKKITNLILNTISIVSSNYEISEANFNMINSSFRTEIPRIIREYEDLCKKNNTSPDTLAYNTSFFEEHTLSEYIRLGEKEFLKRIQGFSSEVRTLFRILFILVKSICINILILESFNENVQNESNFILKTLNVLNTEKQPEQSVIDFIHDTAELDCGLMNKINQKKEEYYGEPSEQEVSFSTAKGKAVLVVGSNLRELEQILDNFSDTNIAVYTHDNMISAHMYPKFREYKNLKGQFGQGMENCLLDFSTFPGPIILTRYSLFNVENLYRGRLFTTDFAYLKGVIPIKNNDFSGVKKSAENSKGFKTGKKCSPSQVGFSYKDIYEKINAKISSDKFNYVVLFGIQGYTNEEQEYFKTFIKHTPKDMLIISLFCCKETENLICLNSNSDNSILLNISEFITQKFKNRHDILAPFCDRHTLSVLIGLSLQNKCDIYIGKWNQTVINSNIFEGLHKIFHINDITTPKNDLANIMRNK